MMHAYNNVMLNKTESIQSIINTKLFQIIMQVS